jgi:hypothetical protein
MRTFDPTLTTTPAAVWIGLKLPPQNRSGAASSSLRLSFVLSHKSLSASQGFQIASRLRRSLRLDQQPLSFVAVAASGEAHDDSVSPAFRLCPREHRPPPSTRDHRAQRSASTQGRYSPLLANHQYRRTGGRSTLRLRVGRPPAPALGLLSPPGVRASSRKALRQCSGSCTALNYRMSASTEARRPALRRARGHTALGLLTILVRSPMSGTASWLPRCATDWSGRHAQGNQSARAASALPLQRQAPNPDEYVYGTHIALCGKRRLRSYDDSTGK